MITEPDNTIPAAPLVAIALALSVLVAGIIILSNLVVTA